MGVPRLREAGVLGVLVGVRVAQGAGAASQHTVAFLLDREANQVGFGLTSTKPLTLMLRKPLFNRSVGLDHSSTTNLNRTGLLPAATAGAVISGGNALPEAVCAVPVSGQIIGPMSAAVRPLSNEEAQTVGPGS